MLADIKAAAIPGALAYLGVRVVGALGGKNAFVQAAAGVGGAIAGIVLAKKIPVGK